MPSPENNPRHLLAWGDDPKLMAADKAHHRSQNFLKRNGRRDLIHDGRTKARKMKRRLADWLRTLKRSRF